MNFILKIVIFIIIFSNFYAVQCQELSASSPLEPGKMIYPIKIGFYSGMNLPLSPSELTGKPTTATKEVQESLMNGLDGLGFGPTMNMGIILKYPLSAEFNIGAIVEYSGCSAKNTCNCDTETYISENALSVLNFSLLSQYFLYEKLYASAELGLNLFGVKVTENSIRGNINFSKSHPRIGLAIGLGYEIPISGKFALDISAKGNLPNLILGAENTGNSESLINAIDETKEAKLFLLSLNFGLLFSL